ncbi:uncharacterized protein LOC100907570 [Galendromus occidentalis]|uniref:Uncharacterized protein LOC100907570 n=1 Tax=Galendromus occidentalis TaxID=34638 RepID=A0AAJ6QUA0_9ACAR|nr:uncharacterized protein LOC100907570 [Galendromus occidentalis]
MLCAPTLSSPLTGGEQLRFKGRKKGQSLLGTAIVVQFGKFFPAKWAQAATATVDEEMTITYSDLVHSVVALLHDNYLPHLAPHQIFQQLCHEGTRTLVVLRDPEETQRDLLNSKSSPARLEFNNNTETMMMSRFGGSAKPWQKIVPSLSGGSDGNGLSVASVSSPEDEIEPDRVVGGGGVGVEQQPGSAAATSDATQSPLDNRQWVSWASMNRRNKEEILNECGSICSDHLYSDVCCDDSSDDDDESIADDEDEMNDCGQMFTKSLEAYLKAVQHRKRERQVGVESRLVACASFSKDYRPSGAKVVVLLNVVVRKKFRRYGIGSFMVKRIKSPSLVGPYDAVTMHIRCGEQCTESAGAAKPVHNQHSSCVSSRKQKVFFEKNSFTSDLILNSRFHEEDGSNVTTGEVLMCFLPPFDSGPFHNQSSNINCTSTQGYGQQPTGAQMAQHNSIKAMQEEAQRWKEKSLEAYQLQMSYMARLQQEVLRLHEQLNKQELTIDQLRKENSRLQTRLVRAEKKTAKALIETLDKEAADFERMCVSRKLSSDVPFNTQNPLTTRAVIRS